MGLLVTRVGEAASLGIWLPTLQEGVSTRRDNHAPSKYRGASKRNLVKTYYKLSVDVLGPGVVVKALLY
jgi:hypothetical protein